jgi:hypothetical protein
MTAAVSAAAHQVEGSGTGCRLLIAANESSFEAKVKEAKLSAEVRNAAVAAKLRGETVEICMLDAVMDGAE